MVNTPSRPNFLEGWQKVGLPSDSPVFVFSLSLKNPNVPVIVSDMFPCARPHLNGQKYVRKQNMTPGRSCTDFVGCILSWLVAFVC